MEDLVAKNLFKGIYRGKKVLVTGHTGFKGSWLVTWLELMGAEVAGYSLQSFDNARHYEMLNSRTKNFSGDINDFANLCKVIESQKPEIVFHLAAQALVRQSYLDPRETYLTNVSGTLNVYEACRLSTHVKAIVSVTSDKVYENNDDGTAFTEDDALGGYDMYSSSKACVEMMTRSYRKSFLKDKSLTLATVRAGNVLGGGDWGRDRLVPDLMRAFEKSETALIRNPLAVRPWQHVLEPLSGYLLVGQKLLEGNAEKITSLNFGPATERWVNVGELAQELKDQMPQLKYEIKIDASAPHEAKLLMVDSTAARNLLQWIPVWDASVCVRKTSEWYAKYFASKTPPTIGQIHEYVTTAQSRQLVWSR